MTEYSAINFTAKLEKLGNNHEQNRNDLRKIVIDKFIKEKAGSGNAEKTAKYKYFVERLSSGDRVYLTRPVPLNKGFDFIIHVENHVFINGKDNPKHEDISDDLRVKKQANSEAYRKLIQALEEVYLCKDPDDMISKYKKYSSVFKQGLSFELILKVVKWLFIEQDIRYWNWSGRSMFMSGIRNI